MINKQTNTSTRGFTVVELLIVIVVVGILAAITVVAYNGVRDRAEFAKMQTDLSNINHALQLYHADNDSYPYTKGLCMYDWCGWDQQTGDGFIAGLSPKYIGTIPQLPDSYASNNTYLYNSDGINYQLIRYKIDGLPQFEKDNNSLLATGNGYDGLAWGYKSDPTMDWW